MEKNIDEIVDRLKNYTTLKNERDIADLLGIAPSDFSNRKKRGTLLPLIVGWCLGQQGINMEWVLRGRNVLVAEGNNNVQVEGAVTIGGVSATPASSMGQFMVFEDVWERVRLFTKWKTQGELAQFLGIQQGSVAGAKQRGAFPLQWAFKIAQHFKVNAEWLLTGEGSSKCDVDLQLLTAIIAEVERMLDKIGRILPASKKAQLIIYLYKQGAKGLNGQTLNNHIKSNIQDVLGLMEAE